MKADVETEAQVLDTLRASWQAYRDRDLQAVLSYYTADADLVAIGTGAGDKYVGPEELRAGMEHDFQQMSCAALEMTWSVVSQAGNVAWVTGDCLAHVDTAFRRVSVSGRLTAVLERRGGRWYIMHSHFSLPAASQPQSQPFPASSRPMNW